jgi:hypothetical protein
MMPDFGGMSADQINASMGFGPGGVGAQGQSQLNNIFGNFGQQTDYYSGLGAAYGRATGGFNGGALPGGDSRDAVTRALMSQQGGSGLLSPTPMAQQGGFYGGLNPQDWATFSNAVGADKAQAWAAQQGGGSPPEQFIDRWDNSAGQFPPPGPAPKPPTQPVTQDWSKYFSGLTAPQQQAPQPSGGGGQDLFAGMSQGDLATWTRAMQAAGRGIEVPSSLTGGSSAPSMNMPTNLGYNPGFGSNFVTGGGNDFQNRFGMGFPNAGTPSQYTASPYTNVQGQTFQPNMPQGFQTQFGPDDPNGALNAAEQQRIFAQTPRS